MTNLEETAGGASYPGPRRSTFQPPAGGVDEAVLRRDLSAGDLARVPAFPSVPSPSVAPHAETAPDPGSGRDAVETPAAVPELLSPPERRSLDDAELVRALEAAAGPHTETITLIEQLQQQLALREAEAARFRRWEETMLALGTPEAVRSIEQTRRAFTGVVPIVPSPPEGPPGAPSDAATPLRLGDVNDVVVDPELRLAAQTVPAPSVAPPGAGARASAVRTETAGLTAVPAEQRTGRTARMFWVWFAANAALVSMAAGAMVLGLGLSLRQALIGVLAGVALSALPLAVGTITGARSGQPTMVVSRAVFGVLGNMVPALLAVLIRVFWGAVTLWIGASAGASLLQNDAIIPLTLAGAILVVALTVALLGQPLLAWVQLVLSSLSGLLVAAVLLLSAPHVDLSAATALPDGSWLLVIGGAVTVFSVVGSAWATSASDVARHQSAAASVGGSASLAALAVTLPALTLVGWGAVLAASRPALASTLATDPLGAVADITPDWFLGPLLAVTMTALVAALTLNFYSAGFAVQALGLPVGRVPAVLVGAVMTVAAFGAVGALSRFDLVLMDVATSVAVPVAAWVGLLVSDLSRRRGRLEPESLLNRGGTYPDVRWSRLIPLLLISALGFGMTEASVEWLNWQGYLLPVLRLPAELAGTDAGVLVALLLGLLVPVLDRRRSADAQEPDQPATGRRADAPARALVD